MDIRYRRSENIGRKYTKTLCEQHNWGCTFTDGEYDSYDSVMEIGGKTCIGEIKVRKREWPDYILEDLKLTEIERAIEDGRVNGDKVLYINWISDKICYIFDLGDIVDGRLIRNASIPIDEASKRLDEDKPFNAHTVESTSRKIPKWVYYLEPRHGVKYEKQDDGTYKKVS